MTTASALRTLDVILTSDCNLRCSYCYQNAKRPGVMRWHVLRRALAMLLRSGHPGPRVFFVGGEPLLAFGLIERAVAYLDAHKPAATTISYDISTNGVHLREREIQFLDSRQFRVQLSFDGVEPAQELRAPGTFDALDRLLDHLRTAHPALFFQRLQVALTVTPESISYLGDSVRYLLAKGVRDVIAAPSLTGERRWTPALRARLDAQFARAFDACSRHYARTGLAPFRCLQAFDRQAAVSDWFCGVGSGESLTVDVDGTMTGCVTFAGSYERFPGTPLGRALGRLRIGHIDRPDLPRRLLDYGRRVEGSGLFNNRRRKYSSYGHCGTCRHLHQCIVCPVAIVHGRTTDDPDRIPDFVCAFNRVSSKYRARFAKLQSARHAMLPSGFRREVRDVIVRHLAALAQNDGKPRPNRSPARALVDEVVHDR